MPHAIPRPWKPADVAKMKRLAGEGLSARLAAKELRRTTGAVKFKAMAEGVRFHAIEQPVGSQKKLGRLRRKVGMHATLRRRAA